MVLNFEKATDKQLMNILKHDNSIPNDLLKEVVEEAVNRKLLQGYVIHAINVYFFDLESVYRKCNVSYDDLMQLAYVAIWRATDTFKAGKAGFVNCFFLPIHRRLAMLLRDNNLQKRKGNTISIHAPNRQGQTLESILPSKVNTEKYVLRKIEVEDQLNKLDERGKKVVMMYTNGYNFPEISKVIGVSSGYSQKIYHRSLKLMANS